MIMKFERTSAAKYDNEKPRDLSSELIFVLEQGLIVVLKYYYNIGFRVKKAFPNS